jgi:pimeloyl-ACP methyl ester carboxylesterase
MVMDIETSSLVPERRAFAGAGVELIGDVVGDPARRPVLLLHGGGQTRHSWSSAAVELARRGYHAVSIDMRGHGDSGWSGDGDYRMTLFRDDVLAMIDQLPSPPVLVGASLGGVASLLAIGESEAAVAAGLVLVDITPRVELSGVARIQAFMNARPDGFETLDEVADAVAAYNPSRPRPRNPAGLLKNLRQRNGRYFWHWDPAFLSQPDVLRPEYFDRLDAAAANVRVPVMLVRGAESEIVSEETVAQMRGLMPEADFVDISGAGHMVAGDRNDAFNLAVFDFLDHHGL